MTAEAAKAGSWLPEEFTTGGFFDDKECTIVGAEVTEFDYAGKTDGEKICALAVTLRGDDAEPDDDDRTEYLKIGDLSKFTPSADRQNYIPVGSATSMNKNCKAALFLKALKEKGFEMSRLGKGVKGLVGVHGHVNIIPIPEMKGIDKKDLTVLIFTRVDAELREVKEKGKTSGKGKGEKQTIGKKDVGTVTVGVASPAAASSVEGAEDKTTEVILDLLGKNDGKLNKSKIPQAMFGAIPSSQGPLRNACIALSNKTDWLSSEERPWKYDGGELSLG